MSNENTENKIEPITIKDIPKAYQKLMFERDKLDIKLDEPREKILNKFIDEYNNPKVNPKIIIQAPRMKSIFSKIFLQYAKIIKSSNTVYTIYFDDDLSSEEARDTNESKRMNDPTLEVNYVRNLFGLIYDKKTGSFIPVNATAWGDLATGDIPTNTFVKVEGRPYTKGGDTENYRVITLSKIIGKYELIIDNKKVKYPSDVSKFVPTITVQEIEDYIGMIVKVTGNVTTYNDKKSKNENYTINMLSVDPTETSMDEANNLLVITKTKPIWEEGSRIAVTGKVFAPKEEKEEDDSEVVIVGGDEDTQDVVIDEPEYEVKGKSFNIMAIKTESDGEEGVDWFKAESNELSVEDNFSEFDANIIDEELNKVPSGEPNDNEPVIEDEVSFIVEDES